MLHTALDQLPRAGGALPQGSADGDLHHTGSDRRINQIAAQGQDASRSGHRRAENQSHDRDAGHQSRAQHRQGGIDGARCGARSGSVWRFDDSQAVADTRIVALRALRKRGGFGLHAAAAGRGLGKLHPLYAVCCQAIGRGERRTAAQRLKYPQQQSIGLAQFGRAEIDGHATQGS